MYARWRHSVQQQPQRNLGTAFGRVSLTLPQLHVMVDILNDALLAVVTDIFSQPVSTERPNASIAISISTIIASMETHAEKY